MITRFRLFESPDRMLYKGNTILYNMYGAYPFGYVNDYKEIDMEKSHRSNFSIRMEGVPLVNNDTGFSIGLEYSIHRNLLSQLGLGNAKFPEALNNFKYAGRFWKDKKVISFWQYPETKDELDEIINEINTLTDINIDDSWEIEIYLNMDKVYSNK
jgi:hypothetical protein